MKTYSIFTELLNELLRYSRKNDTAVSNFSDLVAVQNLEDRITRCYNSNYYSHNEYRILIDLCYEIKTSMREVIRYNQQIKAFRKQSRKNNRKLA